MSHNRKSLAERFDRSIVGGTWNQLIWFFSFVAILLTVFIIITFACDLTIFEKSDALGKVQGVLYHFIDQGNQSMEKDQNLWVQLFTLLISLSGIIFFGGMLISTIINTIERRVSRVEQGLVIYKKLKNHYVIIGYGEMIINIIDEIFEKCCPGYKELENRKEVLSQLPRILILTNQNLDMVRSDIHAQVLQDVEEHIIIYAGDIESREHLSKLNINLAEEVYVLGERNEYGRDTKNIACVDIIADLRGEVSKNDKGLLPVNVQFDRVPSYSIAQKIDIPVGYLSPKDSEKPCIFFRPFNFHENWSRLLWSYYADPDDDYSPLDFEEMKGDKHVHLVIVGLNRMGRALLLEALRLCHYTNYDSKTGANKTKITVVDMAMSDELPFFKAQYPLVGKQIDDIDIEFIEAKVESDSVTQLIDQVAKDKSALLTIAICIKDPDIGMATGLNLPESVYYQKEFVGLSGRNVTSNDMRPRVLIRQELHKGLGEILNKDQIKYKNVKIFGMLNKGISYELLDDRLPMYVNNNYDLLASSARKKNSVEAYDEIRANVKANRDLGFDKWIKLSENYRGANRYQIDMYGYYLRVFKQLGITSIADIDVKITGELLQSLAKVEHRRWVAERTVAGWRQIDATCGEMRTEQFQIHAQIIPYESLPDSEKEKDYNPIKNVMILDKIFKELCGKGSQK